LIYEWSKSIDSVFSRICGLESTLKSFGSAEKSVRCKEKMDSQNFGASCGSQRDVCLSKQLVLIGNDVLGLKQQGRANEGALSYDQLKIVSENLCGQQQTGIRPIDGCNVSVDDKVYFI
jgi:hypothetical protein